MAYLLLFGELPDAAKLGAFKSMLEECRQLPTNFTRDVIMKAPSKDIMNSLTKMCIRDRSEQVHLSARSSVMRQMNSEDAVVTAVSSVQPQDARDVWDGSTV